MFSKTTSLKYLAAAFVATAASTMTAQTTTNAMAPTQPAQTERNEKLAQSAPIDQTYPLANERIQADEAGLQAGAYLYVAQCASRHGTPGYDVASAKWMFPKAPQLWQAHGKGIVGVSDDEVGGTYWKIDNGIRLTGMPAYQKVLSPTQMGQVALLVKNADMPRSPELKTILQGDPAK